MCFESQYLLLVRACQVRCKQTIDRYRTTDMPVIVNNELIPEIFNNIFVLIFVSPNKYTLLIQVLDMHMKFKWYTHSPKNVWMKPTVGHKKPSNSTPRVMPLYTSIGIPRTVSADSLTIRLIKKKLCSVLRV